MCDVFRLRLLRVFSEYRTPVGYLNVAISFSVATRAVCMIQWNDRKTQYIGNPQLFWHNILCSYPHYPLLTPRHVTICHVTLNIMIDVCSTFVLLSGYAPCQARNIQNAPSSRHSADDFKCSYAENSPNEAYKDQLWGGRKTPAKLRISNYPASEDTHH